MSVFPIWISRTGLIGDLSEGQEGNFRFEAIGNDGVSNCVYTFHSGQLPEGLTFGNNDVIGNRVYCNITGTVDLVDFTTVSEFTIRANIGNQFADAAFAISVEGRDAPYFTANSNVGTYLAGQYIANTYQGYQLTYEDQDPNSNVTIGLTYDSNALPYNVNIVEDSGNWYIRGIPVLTTVNNAGEPAVVKPPYSWPRFVQFDANIEIDDGTFTSYQMFTIGINARDYWSADTDNFTIAAQPVTSNLAVIFGSNTVYIPQADYDNVTIIAGDPIVSEQYFPGNLANTITLVTAVTTNVEIGSNTYSQITLSEDAISTSEFDAVANILFLKTSFGSDDNDYLAEQVFDGEIVSGYLYSNTGNLVVGALLTTSNIEIAGSIGSNANVRIADLANAYAGNASVFTYYYELDNYLGTLSSQEFRTTELDQGHPLVFTNPFASGMGYGGRGYYSADMSNKYEPILLSTPGNLRPVINGNFYAFKFVGYDPNGREVFYRVTGGSLPPGLTLNADTGFIYGYVISEFDTTYTFTIEAYIPTNIGEYVSYEYTYSIFVWGRRPSQNTWVTEFDVGTVAVGQASELQMLATSDVISSFIYTVTDGILPPGLKLSETGLIIGRPLFSIFSPGTTGIKTFDFTVTASGQQIVNPQGGIFSVTLAKDFRITVVAAYELPYNSLYIQAYPPAESQGIISAILTDSDSMPASWIYRFEDPNFGIADSLTYLHATGLNVANSQVYFNAMQKNHYHRFVNLAPFKSAVARSPDETIIYEVVYSQLIDNLENNSGVSVGLEVAWPPNRADIQAVYPNSLDNMRERIYLDIGRVNTLLPLWMRSRQSTGKLLGWTPSWVVCYTMPNMSAEIAYRLNLKWAGQLNRINFELDRYELDQSLTWNYTFSTTANVDAGELIAGNVGNGTWANTIDTGMQIVDVNTAANTITINPPTSGQIMTLRVGDNITGNSTATIAGLTTVGYTTFIGNAQGQLAYFINQGNIVPANVIYANSYYTASNTYVSANGTTTIGRAAVENTIGLSNLTTAGFSEASEGSNIYIVGEFVDDNRYNKYLLFPRVNIIY